nr:refilin-B [Pogona vitticeps]
MGWGGGKPQKSEWGITDKLQIPFWGRSVRKLAHQLNPLPLWDASKEQLGRSPPVEKLHDWKPQTPAPPTPPRQDASRPVTPLPPGGTARLCALSFGEGVEFDPLPPKDIRYTSSVKYDSEKHFINNIYLPVGLGLSSCSQTVVCVPDCTWRNYKAEVHFQPRHRARSFASTTIVYPKNTTTVYTTTLDYNCRKYTRRFLSSVELESSGNESG